MKKLIIVSLVLIAGLIMQGCKKEGNYPGGTVSPYMSLFDIRNLYKGNDITLTKENMFGAEKIAVLVVSDHSAGNLPNNLLVVQDRRRLGRLRGVSIPLTNASTYVPGDSLLIDVTGATLTRENNILIIKGITEEDIEKVASGIAIAPSLVKSNAVLSNPNDYESTLISITSASFDPSYPQGSTYAGERLINDGFGNLVLFTESTATFANNVLPYLSNFTGIVFRKNDTIPVLRPRTAADITVLTAVPPKIAAFVITGYLTDPNGTDANYEYIQFKATKDINFAVTPFAIVTTNNAGTSTPTGFPTNGWATGGLRTYKINLTTGTVLKNQYFYVGGSSNIWGTGSTDISSSKWFSKMYATVDGDGFGTKTTNLLANSGNAGGIAVFDSINVQETSVPVDVIFFGGAGSLYSAGPPARGYRITNTDYYDKVNPVTLSEQPFFAMGSNTGKFAFPSTSNFTSLGGKYNRVTGRWTQARMQTNIILTATSTASQIEGGTTIEE